MISLMLGLALQTSVTLPPSDFRVDCIPAACTLTPNGPGVYVRRNWTRMSDNKILDTTRVFVLRTPGLTRIRHHAWTAGGALNYRSRDVTVPPASPTPIPPVLPPILGPSFASVELPRVYLNSDEVPSTGRVISVAAGANLQTAINSAVQGDVIELASGATFVGNFILPNKTGAGWITIRPSNWRSLPAVGVRMRPSVAATLRLPKLQTPNTSNTIIMANGAHHYRLMGLEVGVTPSNAYTYAAIDLGSPNQNTLASVPHDLVLDRMYIHGTATGTLRRCVALNSASTSIIDSWLSDCHENGSDSQAIASWNGPGPFKIVNNYLEGAGENVMFGGSDPAIPNMSPTDIEIRRNHIAKPLSWIGVLWTVKNLFEIKHGVRILVRGNVFENTWAHGQDGTAIAIKTTNQGFKCTWCVTKDVTFQYNIIRNVGGGFNIAGAPDNALPCPCIPAHDIAIHDNLITNINVAPFLGIGRGFSTYGTVHDVFISHNTMLWPTLMGWVFGPDKTTQLNFSATNNFIGGGYYAMGGDNIGGVGALNRYAPSAVFLGNITTMQTTASPSWMPNGNFHPLHAQARAWINPDFSLAASSPYKGKGTDGKDPGADIPMVMRETAGVIVSP